MKQLTVYLVFSFLGSGSCWRYFHWGRYHRGNVRPPPFVEGAPTKALYFQQKLDHFDLRNTNTWNQRYYYNDTYYKAGGPIFLMIGGEGPLSPLWAVSGAWVQYAEKYNASFFALEHRFYGESHPTKDLSLNSLVYLNSQQALADCAYFITSQTEKLGLKSGTKWITMGGFYGGSLASWMRLKYPHLVSGAIASSAPVLAEVDFKDYYKVVRDSLSHYNPECETAIKKGTHQLLLWMKNYLGRRTVNKIFKLCTSSELNSANDDANFYLLLADNFAEVVQYHKSNTQRKNPTQNDSTIDSVCEIMLDSTLILEINKLAMVNYVLMGQNNESCMDYKYNKMIFEMRMTNWGSHVAEGERQWFYQTCSEFGFFPTSSWKTIQKMFGNSFPTEFFLKQCLDVFGPDFNEDLIKKRVARTNMIYGGVGAHTTNVIYVHGSLDPWHPLGITKLQQDEAAAIYIDGTSHCADMYPPSSQDDPQLIDARIRINEFLGKWLKD